MQSGLKKPRVDARDYDFLKSHKHLFGSLTPLPDVFELDPLLWMPNQMKAMAITGFPTIPPWPFGCTNYAQTDLCVTEDGKLYNPVLIEEITHANAYGGAEMRESLDAAKRVFNRVDYFNIKGEGLIDPFDAACLAMYSAQPEKRAVTVGSIWYPEWQFTKADGILVMPSKLKLSGPWHNWIICGWVVKSGVRYLKGKSWQGMEFGDNGFHYIPREVFNAIMAQDGAVMYTLSKVENNQIQTIDVSWVHTIVSYVTYLMNKLNPQPKYLWDNPVNVRHSIRVLCDEAGLSLYDKNVITACIQQESGFNTKAIGNPNKNGTQDFGLCQYNNGVNMYGVPLWIGPGAAFASIDEVLNDPEKGVRLMITTYKAGHINWWSSFSTGAYKKYMP